MTHSFYENTINSDSVQYLSSLIAAYQRGKVSLPTLSSRLDAARSGFLFPEQGWLDTYAKLWGAVEECNALALDAGVTEVLPEHKVLLDRTLVKMQLFFEETFPNQDGAEF